MEDSKPLVDWPLGCGTHQLRLSISLVNSPLVAFEFHASAYTVVLQSMHLWKREGWHESLQYYISTFSLYPTKLPKSKHASNLQFYVILQFFMLPYLPHFLYEYYFVLFLQIKCVLSSSFALLLPSPRMHLWCARQQHTVLMLKFKMVVKLNLTSGCQTTLNAKAWNCQQDTIPVVIWRVVVKLHSEC